MGWSWGLFSEQNRKNWSDSAFGGTNENGEAFGQNWSAWTKSMMGAHGGAGEGGGGLGGAQYFGKAAAGGIGMLTTSIQTDAMVSAYKAQADMAASAARFQGKLSSEDYERQGQAAVRNIGIVQQKGLDETTLRYNALRNEIAAQRVSAAGSGIDLSSRTVGKAEQSSRKAAAWDVSRISERTQIAAQNFNEQAETAYRNSAFATINGEYGAKMAKIQGDLNSDLAEISGKFGMIRLGHNALVNVGKGAADIFSGGWVSTADAANKKTGGRPLGEV